MKKLVKILGISLLAAALLLGCGKQEEESSKPVAESTEEVAESTKEVTEPVEESEEVTEEEKVTYMVSADYVVEHMNDDGVILLDCRGSKSADKKTVAGAVVTTWQEMCTCSDADGAPGDEGWGKIPEASDLAKRCGALGLDKEKEIICLGETLSGWGEDARLAWELIAAGYENVKIVDGGIDAVFDAGAETQKGASEPVSCEVAIDTIDKTHVMETEELQNNYDQYKIVDVRTDKEYKGATKYNEAQGGHLIGAVHIPYTSLFNKDGTLISEEEVIALLEDAGINKDDQIVTYCTGGIRSAYAQMVFEMAGYEKTWNYDQSFWRWAVVGDVEK